MAWVVRRVVVPEIRRARECPVASYSRGWFWRGWHLRVFAVFSGCGLFLLTGLLVTGLRPSFPTSLAGAIVGGLALASVITAVTLCHWLAAFFGCRSRSLWRDLCASPMTIQQVAAPFVIRIGVVYILQALVLVLDAFIIAQSDPGIPDMAILCVVPVAFAQVTLLVAVAVRGYGSASLILVAVIFWVLEALIEPVFSLALNFGQRTTGAQSDVLNLMQLAFYCAIAVGLYRLYDRTPTTLLAGVDKA